MKVILHTMKAGMAVTLLALILMLSGLAIARPQTVNLSTLSASAGATLERIAAPGGLPVTAAATPVSSGTTQQVSAAQQQAPAQSGANDARSVVRAVGPAVVTVVNSMKQQSSGQGGYGLGQGQQAPEASGSGVIIDSQGDIVTNEHVVANAQSVEVIFADGTRAPATLVGGDTYSDIAVIKVSVKVPSVAHFGNSDSLEAGQPVVAIGTALGNYNNTVTEGIVSGLHRQLGDGSTSTQDMIQTDAAINHGNSGGPLLDLNGNVVGINTAVVRDDGTMGSVAEGLGFAIPSNTAQSIAVQLIQKGSISRPYIGIGFHVITPQVAAALNLTRQQGIYVTDVVAGSPASKAGIQNNSIITKLDGVALGTDNNSALPTLLSKHKIGDSVKLTVIEPNSTSEHDVTVVLAARPAGQ